MATEEQTAYNTTVGLYSGSNKRAGQRLTISGRTVSHLSLVLDKYGNPTGDITFTIRRVSDDSVISSKVWGDASGLSTDPAWKEVTFDTPQTIDEEVRICAEFAGGDVNNQVLVHVQAADVKANEYVTYYSDTSWTALTSYDTAYIYTYSVGWSGKVSGVTDPAKVMSVAKANIKSVIGVE